MAWITVKINKEGLEKLELWTKGKLSDEEQDKLAGCLDDTFEFGGVLGAGVELVDGKLFKTVLSQGVSAVFPGDENLKP